MQHFTHCRLIL